MRLTPDSCECRQPHGGDDWNGTTGVVGPREGCRHAQ